MEDKHLGGILSNMTLAYALHSQIVKKLEINVVHCIKSFTHVQVVVYISLILFWHAAFAL